jgi:pyruvate formate lyase activating enzyme
LVDRIHSLGLKVKIDTNGCFPDALEGLPADYIAMDIKTAPERYGLVLDAPELAAETARSIQRSIRIVLASGIAHEFRTTAAPGLVTAADAAAIARLIRGCDRYVLQRFSPHETLEPGWRQMPATSDEALAQLAAAARSEGLEVSIRNGLKN